MLLSILLLESGLVGWNFWLELLVGYSGHSTLASHRHVINCLSVRVCIFIDLLAVLDTGLHLVELLSYGGGDLPGDIVPISRLWHAKAHRPTRE